MSDSIKRYENHSHISQMREDDIGEWVQYDDYQSAIDCLQSERYGWIEQHHRDSVQLRAPCSERDVAWLQCKELSAQLAECKADAERYRWLRKAHGSTMHGMWHVRDYQDCVIGQQPEELDAAIDSARKGVE